MLGLDLRYDGAAKRLRIWDPVADEYLRTLGEEERARKDSERRRVAETRQRIAEERARQEAERQRDAEARTRLDAERRWKELELQLTALRRSR